MYHTNALKKRLENRNDRAVVLLGNDYYTEIIYKELISFKKKYNVIYNLDIDLIDYKKNYVLVACFRGHGEIYDKLISKGFIYQKDFSLMGPQGYYDELNLLDPLLGYSRIDDLPGIRLYDSNKLTDNHLVVTLGGSNTDPSAGNEKSWSKSLHEKLLKKGYRYKVANGGIAGYNSTQDLLKLIRDVIPMKPDIVISYGGFNDVKNGSYIPSFPTVHRYQKKFYDFLSSFEQMAPCSLDMRDIHKVTYGIPNNKDCIDIWIDNMRTMYVICKEFGIKFYGILQPTVFLDYSIDVELQELLKKMGIDDAQRNDVLYFYNGVRNRINDYDYLYNLSEIFGNQKEVYYDNVHVYAQGNEMIAKQIFEIIQDDLGGI